MLEPYVTHIYTNPETSNQYQCVVLRCSGETCHVLVCQPLLLLGPRSTKLMFNTIDPRMAPGAVVQVESAHLTDWDYKDFLEQPAVIEDCRILAYGERYRCASQFLGLRRDGGATTYRLAIQSQLTENATFYVDIEVDEEAGTILAQSSAQNSPLRTAVQYPDICTWSLIEVLIIDDLELCGAVSINDPFLGCVPLKLYIGINPRKGVVKERIL